MTISRNLGQLIDSSGNVGVGVTPSAWATGTYKVLQVGKGATLHGSPSGNYAILSANNYTDAVSTKYIATDAASYYMQNAGVHAWYNAPSGTAGTTATFTQQMTLTLSGYLLLGYTTSNGAYRLQVNSQIFATSATIATSDGRYKKDVRPLTNALDIVNALNPVSFAWKPHPVHNFTDGRTTGFIAQEVQQALAGTDYGGSIIKANACTLPDGTTEDFLGIAEGNLIAVLTKALQEQQALITALAARVVALEAA